MDYITEMFFAQIDYSVEVAAVCGGRFIGS